MFWVLIGDDTYSSWWFQIFFIFTPGEDFQFVYVLLDKALFMKSNEIRFDFKCMCVMAQGGMRRVPLSLLA